MFKVHRRSMILVLCCVDVLGVAWVLEVSVE